jgi:hypothetical protein
VHHRVNHTGGNDTCVKIAACINDTGGKFCHQVPLELLTMEANLPLATTPVATCHRYQRHSGKLRVEPEGEWQQFTNLNQESRNDSKVIVKYIPWSQNFTFLLFYLQENISQYVALLETVFPPTKANTLLEPINILVNIYFYIYSIWQDGIHLYCLGFKFYRGPFLLSAF